MAAGRKKLLHEVASRIHDWAVPLGAHVDTKLLEMRQVDEANGYAWRICVFFLGWAVFVSSMNATACYFVTGMEHENAEIARGLRRRDADLLDRLIEQYQHRLLRYLVYLAGNRVCG